MPNLSALQEEAYARVRPGRHFLHAIKIEHPGLTEPLRFITGIDEDVSLPEVFNQAAVVWVATAFDITLPEQSMKEGVGEGQLSVDGVSDELREHVEALAALGVPAAVTYFNYEVSMAGGSPNFTAVTAPIYTYGPMNLDSLSLDATSARGSIKPEVFDDVNLPRETFDAVRFPAINA